MIMLKNQGSLLGKRGAAAPRAPTKAAVARLHRAVVVVRSTQDDHEGNGFVATKEPSAVEVRARCV